MSHIKSVYDIYSPTADSGKTCIFYYPIDFYSCIKSYHRELLISQVFILYNIIELYIKNADYKTTYWTPEPRK